VLGLSLFNAKPTGDKIVEKDIENFIRGLQIYDPGVVGRAQEHSLEMLALLLIVGSSLRIEVGPIEASVLNSTVRERIWKLVETCAPEVSLLKVERLAERHS
jgi:hypothetical protein